MKIKSIEFIKSIIGSDSILEDRRPQIAFIGRSNVGKSSLINSLTKSNMARTSSFPGRTQQLNIFLINKNSYLVDMPGYGYAKASHQVRAKLAELINWYLFLSGYEQKKVVLIIDAKVGLTEDDEKMLGDLEDNKKEIIVFANKIDKIKKNELPKRLIEIQKMVGKHKVIPYSSESKLETGRILDEIFG